MYISFYIDGIKATRSSAFIAEDQPYFRYVVVPGGNPASGGRQSLPVDYNDYQAVKAYYNLPD